MFMIESQDVDMDYHEIRERFITALRAAIQAQESGNLAQIESGYDELDVMLPRSNNLMFDKLHITLVFWDSWIDARNHDWLYYKGISKADWVQLAQQIVENLYQDREITNEQVLQNFDLRRRLRG